MQNISYGSLFLSDTISGLTIAFIVLTVIAAGVAVFFGLRLLSFKKKRDEEIKSLGTEKSRRKK